MATFKESTMWNWLKEIQPENIATEQVLQAYRLKASGMAPCDSNCKSNCRKNPYCIWGLGEKDWILGGSEDNNTSDEDNNFESKRQQNDILEITNGATRCVNAVIRLWYHNPIIRRAILGWRAPYADADDTGISRPLCPVGYLQGIFARMKSNQSTLDPTILMESLRLNMVEQDQDAQQFAKMFFSRLFEKVKDDAPLGELKRSFEGTSRIQITCKKCRKKYSREETFTELNLCVKDTKNISASFTKLLEEEELTGDYQYLCEQCSKKTDAIRRFRIMSLPPVLNIHLQRFVYQKDGKLKKVASNFEFPQTLDLSRCLRSPLSSKASIYSLTGYVVQSGKKPSANGVTAYVRDVSTGAWHVFGDRSDPKEEPAAAGATSNHRDNDKKYRSKEVSILVYTRSKLLKNAELDPEIPAYLRQKNAEENAKRKLKRSQEMKHPPSSSGGRKAVVEAAYSILKNYVSFESTVHQADAEVVQLENDKVDTTEGAESQQISLGKGPYRASVKVKHAKGSKSRLMETQSKSSLCSKDLLFSLEFIPARWITKFLDKSLDTVPKIDMKSIRCPHNKLVLPSQKTTTPYKAITVKAADILYENYGAKQQRLQGNDALCTDCVILECKRQKCLMELQDDYEYVENVISKTQKSVEKYLKTYRSGFVDYTEDFWSDKLWISKKFLKEWRLFASKITADRPKDCNYKFENDSAWNEDIKCHHGNLALNESDRQVISKTVWEVIQKYYPQAFEAPVGSVVVCAECQSTETRSKRPAGEQKKVTDYFQPARRSQRQQSQALMEMQQKLLIQALINGTDEGLKVVNFPDKGRGVVTCRRFQKGEFVVEYAGNLITFAKAKENEAKYSEDPSIGCYMYYFQFKNRQYCIDATEETGRLGRLANHSRFGNCITKVVEVNRTPRLILIAKRDIEAGEEILYDYGDRRRTAVKDHPWLNM